MLHQQDQRLTSAVWFPMLSKGCGADYICMPAPVHNPDGSESLWCYTRPTELYGELRDSLGHFPLQHLRGPGQRIKSTAWIVDSAVVAVEKFSRTSSICTCRISTTRLKNQGRTAKPFASGRRFGR
ncbi:MAG: hypothetical protein R3C99_09220 [Pirellulaceae bacterium]